MRALTLYNDVLNAGVSLLVNGDKALDWESLESSMESKIGDLRDVDGIAKAIKAFPVEFGQVNFIKASIYRNIHGRTVEERNMEVNSALLGISQRGFVVYNPEEIVVDFA